MPSPEAAKRPAKKFILAFALAASLAALWGFGHRLNDTLSPQFTGIFQLQGWQLALTQSIYNLVYLLCALPAALYARRFGYKATILLGLGFVAVGAFTFYPAAETLAFPYYLLATICIAQGWLTLEIAANPLFAAWGSPEHAVFRLNLAQSLYPAGALAGIFAGRWLLDYNLVLPQAGFAYSIAHPYIVVGACVLLLAFVFEETDFPAVAQARIPGITGIGSEIKMLLAQPLLRYAMAAQFGGIVAMGTTLAVTADAVHSGFPQGTFVQPGDVIFLCTGLFAIGRVAGTALMYKRSPAKLLVFYAASGCLMAAIAAVFGGTVAALGVLGLNLALSITWPTILGLAIQGLGQEMKVATALLALTGALGAVVCHMALAAVGERNGATELAITVLCCAVTACYGRACARAPATPPPHRP